MTSGDQKLVLKSRLSLGAVRQNPGVNLACNLLADAGFDGGIAHMAPPWASAVDFGGAKIRARIALSLGAVPPNPGLNLACHLFANAGFDDSITHMASPWGSAVDIGGRGIRARIALSLGAVCPNLCSHGRHWRGAEAEIVDNITVLAPQWGSAVDFGEQETGARIALSLGAGCQNRGMNSACDSVADAEFVDSITLLAPPWGSAVHFGGPKIRARIALSLGASVQTRE